MEATFDRVLVKETGFAFDTTDDIDGLVSSWDNPIVRRSPKASKYRKGLTRTGKTNRTVIYNNDQAKDIILEGEELFYIQEDSLEAEIIGGTIQPLNDYVLVEPFIPDEVLPSGLILTGKKDEKNLQGHIRSIGPNVEAVVIGDLILYGKVSGHSFTFKGLEYRLMREDHIFGILES
jgi:co-chaperonin GroES (HSP10)